MRPVRPLARARWTLLTLAVALVIVGAVLVDRGGRANTVAGFASLVLGAVTVGAAVALIAAGISSHDETGG